VLLAQQAQEAELLVLQVQLEQLEPPVQPAQQAQEAELLVLQVQLEQLDPPVQPARQV